MALFELVNTELQFSNPLDNSLEAAFGNAALELLKSDSRNSLDELMELYAQARSLVRELDKLVKAK